jgi:hypothetical protein
MYSIPIVISMSLTTNKFDPDGWWHLRTGQWIVENRAVPVTDTFSIMKGTRWVAYSWLYELLLYGLYNSFGLPGFVIYGVLMSLTITFALYSMLRTLSGRIILSIALTSAGILAMAPMLHIRSFTFSILFLSVELFILYRVRATSNVRLLLPLPFLFILWANTHIQFVFGLFAYVMMTLEVISDGFRFEKGQRPNKMKNLVTWMIGVGIACGLATLATPYHVQIYKHLLEIVRHQEFYKYISELQSPSFRSINTWAFLFIILGTTFVIGWRKIARPFPLILFGFGIVMSFRSYRDAWFAIIIGLGIIAYSCAVRGEVEKPHHMKSLVIICLTLILLFMWHTYGVSNEKLRERLVQQYPVAAAEFVEKRRYPGPLYNEFNWGGYLIWRLPKRLVSVDGRGYIYGSRRFERGVQTWSAKPGWENDPDLTSARTIIASRERGLTSVLLLDPRFELVYEDEISLVFLSVISGQQDLVFKEKER